MQKYKWMKIILSRNSLSHHRSINHLDLLLENKLSVQPINHLNFLYLVGVLSNFQSKMNRKVTDFLTSSLCFVLCFVSLFQTWQLIWKYFINNLIKKWNLHVTHFNRWDHINEKNPNSIRNGKTLYQNKCAIFFFFLIGLLIVYWHGVHNNLCRSHINRWLATSITVVVNVSD